MNSRFAGFGSNQLVLFDRAPISLVSFLVIKRPQVSFAINISRTISVVVKNHGIFCGPVSQERERELLKILQILTWPSSTNINFPYHVRTSQVGDSSSPADEANYPQNAYEVSKSS